jgi:hypothetical protein
VRVQEREQNDIDTLLRNWDAELRLTRFRAFAAAPLPRGA